MNVRLATEIDSKALLLLLDESTPDTALTVTIRDRQTSLFLGSEGWRRHPCLLPLERLEYDLPTLSDGQNEKGFAWRATKDQTQAAYGQPFVQIDLPPLALTAPADWPPLPKPVIPEPIAELPPVEPEAPEPPPPETNLEQEKSPYARRVVLGLLAAASFALGAGIGTTGSYNRLNSAAEELKLHIVAADGRQKASEDEIRRLRSDISRYSAEIEAKGNAIKNGDTTIGLLRADVRQRDSSIADQKATLDSLNKAKGDLEARLKANERALAKSLEARAPTQPVVAQADGTAARKKYDDLISRGTLPFVSVFKDIKGNIFLYDGSSLDIARSNASITCKQYGAGCWEVFNLSRYSFRCMAISYPNTAMGERALGWGESNEEARKMASASCTSKNDGASCSVDLSYSLCR